jgi:exodeoxyribonuclease V gamma subunit
VLYVSWAGRSVRDNSEQPPSVLVAQLRDHLAAVWGEDVVNARTTEHPLQPFGRRYFEPGSPLFTYADEWRSAHEAPAAAAPHAAAPGAAPDAAATAPLTLRRLADFLKNPVKDFFRQRLQVVFPEQAAPVPEDEPFALAGLDRWQLLDDALQAARRRFDADPQADVVTLVQRRLAREARAGRLPLAAPGRHAAAELAAELAPMLAQVQRLLLQHALPLDRRTLWLPHPQQPGLVLDDVLEGLRAGVGGPVLIELRASRIARGKKDPQPRPEKFVETWLRLLAAAATGEAVSAVLVGTDAVATVAPLAADEAPQARATLLDLMQAAAASAVGDEPWPTALRTGLALLADDGSARTVYEGSGHGGPPGEGREPCLARLFPDYETLAAVPGFDTATTRLYAAYRGWLAAQVSLQRLEGAALADDEADAAAVEAAA